MSYGSISRQEREFLACVIRQLPELGTDDRQQWINNQGQLEEALESALRFDYKRQIWDRLERAVARHTKGVARVVLLDCLRDGSPENLDNVARYIIQLVDPSILEE